MVHDVSIAELLQHINAHTKYTSRFLPIIVQAEPMDVMESEEKQERLTLPQLKARYEYDLMHANALLVLGDAAAVRRFDFQMPELLKAANFSLEKVQVTPGTSIDLKARQLLNQIRELFHVQNKVVLGGL